MHIDDTKQSIMSFVEKSFDELRKNMGVAPLGATIGITCDDAFVAERVPASQLVEPGIYIDHIESMSVEVLDHDPSNDMVSMMVQVNGTPAEERKLQAVSGFTFHYIFRKAVIDPMA
jgi:hypothetical protein